MIDLDNLISVVSYFLLPFLTIRIVMFISEGWETISKPSWMRETLKHPRNTAKDPNKGASEEALQNMPIIMLILRASTAVLSM
jgi:hypothetical protein